MISGNIIIAFVLMQYALFFLSLLDKDMKEYITSKNIRLEQLRTIENKTLDEQKEFLSLKYGTMNKAKWTFKKWVKDSLKGTLVFLIFFIPLYYSTFRPNLWITLLISIIVTYIINKILIRFNLQRQDGIDTLFR